MLLSRVGKKSPAKRYGKPVMVPSSDSGAASDVGQGQSSISDGEGEDAFPASYQAPLAGLMSKGRVPDISDSLMVLVPACPSGMWPVLLYCMQIPCTDLAHQSCCIIHHCLAVACHHLCVLPPPPPLCQPNPFQYFPVHSLLPMAWPVLPIAWPVLPIA